MEGVWHSKESGEAFGVRLAEAIKTGWKSSGLELETP